MIFERNCKWNSNNVVACDSLVYSYISVLAFWIIAIDCFYTDALNESWVLSEELRISIGSKGDIGSESGISDKGNIGNEDNIDEDGIGDKGLVVDFYCKDCEKKEKESWMGILNRLKIRFSI